jgi:hypothetical protein
MFLHLTVVIDFSSASTAIFYSALWPCLTAIIDFSSAHRVMHRLMAISIFYLPHSKDQFFFRLLTAILIFYSLHGEDQFFYCLLTAKIDFSFASSRQYQFSICLIANINFSSTSSRPYQFSICLTAKNDFSSTSSRQNRFTICLTAIIDFSSAYTAIRLTAISNPHGGIFFGLTPCLTAMRTFSLPHGGFSASRRFLCLTAILPAHIWLTSASPFSLPRSNMPLRAISLSIWPHPGDIIIDLASPPCLSGQ